MKLKLQKLFLVAVVLKIGFSLLGLYLSDPWICGFALPIAVMLVYVLLGFRRSQDDVSDEKFADSCYYLGFIFTITSILISLFDISRMGTDMSLIATRFGAAMVSTVVGLSVRVYLVGFRQNMDDAMTSAEDSVVDATNRLREQLTIAYEHLQNFEARVHEGTQKTLENVAEGVDTLTSSYAQKMTSFFEELSAQNKAACEAALEKVAKSSDRLAQSVDGYSLALGTNLKSLEQKVELFSEGVNSRLLTTTFPDDFFSSRLSEPLSMLHANTSEIAQSVGLVSSSVAESVTGIRTSLSQLRARSDEIGDALSRVTTLAQTQEQIFLSAQTQIDSITVISNTLRSAQQDFGRVSNAVERQTQALEQQLTNNRAQSEGLSATTAQTITVLNAVEQNLGKVSEALGSRTQQVEDNMGAVLEHMVCLRESAEQVGPVSQSILEAARQSAGQQEAIREILEALQHRPQFSEGFTPETLIGLTQAISAVHETLIKSGTDLAGLTDSIQAFERTTGQTLAVLGEAVGKGNELNADPSSLLHLALDKSAQGTADLPTVVNQV